MFDRDGSGGRPRAHCDESFAGSGGSWRGAAFGPAARLALDCIKNVEIVEYEELGMEAVWKIDVVDFPAFIVVDDKGHDFFSELAGPNVVVGKK